MIKNLYEVKQRDLRLVLLRILKEDPDYSLNTSLLQDCAEMLSHSVSRDVIHAECAWLQDVGLVTIEQLGNVTIVTLTGRGVDVATGKAIVPGVKRPRPHD